MWYTSVVRKESVNVYPQFRHLEFWGENVDILRTPINNVNFNEMYKVIYQGRTSPRT